MWWTGQLTVMEACYRYDEDDPRCASRGVTAGSSIHLSLLEIRDFAEALGIRRGTNLAAVHRNGQRQAKNGRLTAAYEQKSAVWNAGSGYRGRKPAPAALPALEPEVATAAGQVMVSANTETHFRMVQSFAFDRAYDRNLMPSGETCGAGSTRAAAAATAASCRARTGRSRARTPIPGSSPGLASWWISETRSLAAGSSWPTGDGARQFASPLGYELDLGNLADDFVKPAVTALCAEGGRWSDYPDLAGFGLKLFRKQGISLLAGVRGGQQ